MTLSDIKVFTTLLQRIFEAAGTPADEARVVAEHLVEAELMGLSSHGVQRVMQYVADIGDGSIKPAMETLVDSHSPTTALLDGQWGFGQVAACRAVDTAADMAGQYGTGCVVLRRVRHVGRLGAYTEMLAGRGFAGLAVAMGGKEGQRVAPFGGRDPRLCTNPIAFAVPTGGDPIAMDFSTSAAPEGKLRYLRDTGQTLSDPMILDKEGRASTDPADLYAPDGSCAGAILPFGGDQGYKGYGLGLMVHILGGALGDPVWEHEDIRRFTNGMWLLAIRIDAFVGTDAFRADMDNLAAHVRSSRPAEGSDGVRMPGETEFRRLHDRTANGLPIDADIWRRIVDTAESLGVAVAASLP